MTGRHGGPRPNQTGRPPRGGEAATERRTVNLTPAELAELEDGLLECETCLGFGVLYGGSDVDRHRCLDCGGAGRSERAIDVLREGGLMLVRGRKAAPTGGGE